ncbi:MAG TPA: hypothetical protein VHO03_16925 [Ignavibacteriales bacterium]|nr:hypothetical protein [Ignavibacteriales bacterium]
MKNIKKGVIQTLALSQADLPQDKTITLTIVGENGNILQDRDGNPIQDKPLRYLDGKYKLEITISENEPEGYIRLYFDSTDALIDEAYQPEDARLMPALPASGAELVPTQYFIDFILASEAKMDESFQTAVNTFILNNRKGLQSYLMAAQGELETSTMLYFTERTITDEKRDYYFDRFPPNLWQFQTYYPPINELISFKIKYGNNPIAEIAKNLLVFDRMMGLIEFLPAPGGDSAGIYSLLLSNLNGLGLVLFGPQTNLERVPGMFQVSYKTGLIYSGTDPMEKEMIRQAVARRALVKMMPVIDPAARTPSRTEGIDGVTATMSYSMDKLLQGFKEEEEQFKRDIMMKYGKTVEMTIV